MVTGVRRNSQGQPSRDPPQPFGVLIFDNRMMKRIKNFRRGFSQCLTAAKRSRLRPTTRKRNKEKRTASEVQAASRGRRTAGARAARPVRELRRQMQARQGWRYPADAVSRRRWRMQGAGGQAAASGCGTTSPKKDEGRAAERDQGDMRGLFRRRSGAERFRPRRAVQDCDPKLYMYTASGRMDAQNARPDIVSTVAAKQAARGKGKHTLTHYKPPKTSNHKPSACAKATADKPTQKGTQL